MSERVVMIDVDDLGIDAVNIRGGEWDYDEELVSSIRENGIIVPLTVRPADPSTGKKYAIICGSRRYNAGIEAGLREIPCLIREVDDVTAMGLSIMENKHRRGIPGWRYALQIGQMYERLNHKEERPKVVKIIMAKTGLSDASIREYLDIAGLPGEIIELMKKPEERSDYTKELAKRFLLEEDKILDVHKAAMISRELGREGYPLDRMFEVASVAVTIPQERVKEFLEKVKVYPKTDARDVYMEKVLAIPVGRSFSLEFSSTITRALDEACLRKQLDPKTLIINYVEEGLRRDGFL